MRLLGALGHEEGGTPGGVPLVFVNCSSRSVYCLTMIGPLHTGPGSLTVAPPMSMETFV